MSSGTMRVWNFGPNVSCFESSGSTTKSQLRYGSDEEVTRYLTWGPNSPTDTTAYLKRVARETAREPRTSFTLAVATLDDELIASPTSPSPGSVDRRNLATFWRGNRGDMGYATEVARRLIVFGFDELRLRRITATCHPITSLRRESWRRRECTSKRLRETTSEFVRVASLRASRPATKVLSTRTEELRRVRATGCPLRCRKTYEFSTAPEGAR